MRKAFRNTALAALLALAGAAACAAGDHAGGHGHGHGHDAGEAIGRPGNAARATRTVKVDMTDDMRFSPARITVRQGETVRFVVRNAGALKHELVLGTEKELQAHYEAMKKNPEMEHADPNMVTLDAGRSGEIVWQFTRAGRVDFGCLQPGHYDAGMKGAVTVAKTGAK
ncbi:putative cupredoxin-like copper-binding protein [Variovorax sp. TBS-050B]|uniref:cupredoxin domain-containing protein n=1 Tax=Variovorax sp. TBS-050B TaxID=2940551 RepID=UPI0024747314|nr:cupredoxin family protein [Variovorax sp. TBS-050B]MDH6590367.1 putative cupredoxin-like copper-binding protein [Variovorax sp. TBS-050B]